MACADQFSEATTLAASLRDDARDAIYSGVLSIAEAIQGLDRQLYSWTTVKLYYSVCYFARAALGLHGIHCPTENYVLHSLKRGWMPL